MLTDKFGLIPLEKELKDVNMYTFNKAVEELKRELPKLGLTYKQYQRLGKETLLKKRFSYGKKWIV